VAPNLSACSGLSPWIPPSGIQHPILIKVNIYAPVGIVVACRDNSLNIDPMVSNARPFPPFYPKSQKLKALNPSL
jgi:hypothetical protein